MLAVQPTPAGSGGVPGLRVAITGLGVVGPCGVGRDAFWNGLLQKATGEIRRVEDFDATWLFGPKEIRRCDRFTQFAAVAAAEAIEDAGGVDALHVDPERAGVFVGIGVGGLETLETQIAVKMEKGPRRVSPFLVPMMMPNASAANISMRYGFRGPCENTATACAAGTHSVGNGARLIASGRCDVVLAGSSEAVLTEMGLTGFRNMTALSTSGVSMPFDRNRDGFVISEGGAVLMLEELEHARARGAHIYGELAGAASNADAYDITAPSPGGAGAAACMEQALVDAELSPSDIVHINAHGTSTTLNDAAEAEAITKVFGTPGPLVTSTKGVTGHALGAAGSLEAVALVLTMHHRLIPPTFGLRELDPELHIRVVTGDPQPWEPGPAMSNSFGFGGHNGSIVVIPPAD